MTTCTIEAHEEREVACFYIHGAYLHTLTDEEVIMLLNGTLEEVMLILYPLLYHNYVMYNSKWVPLLYVNMKNIYTVSSRAPYCSTRI